MNKVIKKIPLFSVPISITPLIGALAIITQWVTEWKSTRSIRGTKSIKGKTPREEVATSMTSDTSDTFGTSGTFPKIVTTPNPEMVVACQKDPEFLKALQSADLAIPDGWGIVAAMRLLQGKSGFTLHASRLQRISGLSLMEDLIALATRNGWRVMLLGGKPGIAQRVAKILVQKTQNTQVARTPEESEIQRTRKDISGVLKLRQSDVSGSQSFPSVLNIVGLSGPQDISHASPHDFDHLITSINKIKPDLLFVAFGHGKQEKWLSATRDRLHAGVAMGVGGALDQIVDPTLRPPAYINSIGLGWLYRLFREPWRARRQLALARFAFMVLRIFVRRI